MMTNNAAKTGTKIGAVIGGIAFIFFGLLPGFYFGSYAALVILSRLLGGPLEPTITVRILTVIGVALGIFCIGSTFIVIGAIFGTLVGYLTEKASGKGEVKPPKEEVKHD